ncbi:hypothetical protein OGATHE_000999 [Ogataea polymorpha]|uniref:Uncharacterized protein n=1 Tax=Ogataea polymorpha TaxID=460523 RepID=A0A9P8TG46_9ASCO|nr:hypothetical protein OGATHE_000999 [Ogataea polymorpha]
METKNIAAFHITFEAVRSERTMFFQIISSGVISMSVTVMSLGFLVSKSWCARYAVLILLNCTNALLIFELCNLADLSSRCCVKMSSPRTNICPTVWSYGSATLHIPGTVHSNPNISMGS